MIRAVVGASVFIEPSLADASDACKSAMLASYASGSRPIITDEVSARETALARVMGPSVEIVDCDAAPTKLEAIGAAHAELRAVGVTIDSAMMRTRLNGETYATSNYSGATQQRRANAHAQQVCIADAAHSLVTRIESEHRSDVTMSAGELAKQIVVNGKVHVAGKALTEQAIRGLAARLGSPMLAYLLGVRDRMAQATSNAKRLDAAAHAPDVDASDSADLEKQAARLRADAALDRACIGDVLSRECMRAPDTELVLRTRNGNINDVFAIVSPGYTPADAPSVLPRLLAALPGDAKGSCSYDPGSTAWELRASVWTPTATNDLAVGEPFSGYVSARSRDNGTGCLWIGGGCEMLACLNALVYAAEGRNSRRVHRRGVVTDLPTMIAQGRASIDVLCRAWGVARDTEIPQTAAEKDLGAKFMTDLWTTMLRDERELVGVLPGRSASHAESLARTYESERRDHGRLVRSDLAQAWTRHIQDQPGAVRQDAEQAIGRWLVAA